MEGPVSGVMFGMLSKFLSIAPKSIFQTFPSDGVVSTISLVDVSIYTTALIEEVLTFLGPNHRPSASIVRGQLRCAQN
jgi:hypothetical protein